VVLLGDVNIDFLKYNSHQPTERYLDMLYENNFIPVITKPTRITDHTKTLIDHIYTNTPIDQVVSDIGLFDISDHLPVFCILRMSIKREYYKRIIKRVLYFIGIINTLVKMSIYMI
jgi:endonuclease/exonuclease/phosphatase family metal-dependent hydrolase